MPINQPANQIKLTNVSVVRLKKGGKRFEIACYKNKVREWRTGVEKDLDEVVQINQVFVNVSKGLVASSDDVSKHFGTSDLEAVVKEVLAKGELQVGDKERSHELQSLRRDVATQVAERCVDPASQRPYTVGIIEKAMHDIHFAVKPGKNAKSQALEVIRQLQSSNTIPIERARMKVRVTMSAKDAKRLKEKVVSLVDAVEEEDWGEEWELIATINPGALRLINELLESGPGGGGGGGGGGATGGRCETLSFSSVRADEAGFDERLE